MKYRNKIQAEMNPATGEVNEEPSMTIEGEYMEMKDILNYAKNGGQIPKTDVQYFRPDEIQEINSLYKASLDLTDIDALRQKNRYMNETLEKAIQRKAQEQKENETVSEPKPQPEPETE